VKIAIIPARGGSKRIPRKNIKSFFGKPMVGRAIETALESEVFDHVIVSTDDEEIAEVAIRYGATVPFRRPAHLADDFTDTRLVICHAIDWFKKNIGELTSVCCIYATSPMMLAGDLKVASEISDRANNAFVLPVTTYQFPISRALILNKDKKLEAIDSDSINTRSQDLTETYHDAGQFYFASPKTWFEEKSILSRKNIPLIIPRYRVQDIDTIEDWIFAEKLYGALHLADSQ
jgi:pseudaminic acid cytidylyltransferase